MGGKHTNSLLSTKDIFSIILVEFSFTLGALKLY